jgi:calcineurin-like phosphoesterase family protein
MTKFFTSDHHFGHANMIRLAKRPFANVDEMDVEMVKRWNDRVAPGDLVYHLGDFAKGDHAPYLRRLRGQKVLIPGNHDHSKYIKLVVRQNLWSEVIPLKSIKIDDTIVVLCHYALRVWRSSHHGALHLYGHSHGNLPGDSQSLDVGVDCWDFFPVTLEEIKARLATQRERGHPDHHQPRIAAVESEGWIA